MIIKLVFSPPDTFATNDFLKECDGILFRIDTLPKEEGKLSISVDQTEDWDSDDEHESHESN